MGKPSKIKSTEASKAQMDLWHSQGLEVVFTNGCFDILHIGHIKCLQSTRDLGDKLVVGVNSDESVKKLKGEKRPVNTLSDRMEILSALEFVDLVVAFDEDTPEQLIQHLRPDILVKGNEYKIENIAGASDVLEWGGKVEVLPMIKGHSTTELIQKIKNL